MSLKRLSAMALVAMTFIASAFAYGLRYGGGSHIASHGGSYSGSSGGSSHKGGSHHSSSGGRNYGTHE